MSNDSGWGELEPAASVKERLSKQLAAQSALLKQMKEALEISRKGFDCAIEQLPVGQSELEYGYQCTLTQIDAALVEYRRQQG